MEEKIQVASLSVASNTFLTIAKVVIGLVGGSVSILSEGIHSGIDLLASFIALFAVRESEKPADSCHAYGHGKIENVSGTIEAVLIEPCSTRDVECPVEEGRAPFCQQCHNRRQETEARDRKPETRNQRSELKTNNG